MKFYSVLLCFVFSSLLIALFGQLGVLVLYYYYSLLHCPGFFFFSIYHHYPHPWHAQDVGLLHREIFLLPFQIRHQNIYRL